MAGSEWVEAVRDSGEGEAASAREESGERGGTLQRRVTLVWHLYAEVSVRSPASTSPRFSASAFSPPLGSQNGML